MSKDASQHRNVQPGSQVLVPATVESLGHDDQHIIVRVGNTPVQVPGVLPYTAAAERERIRDGVDVIAERYKNAGVFARCVVDDVRKLLATPE